MSSPIWGIMNLKMILRSPCPPSLMEEKEVETNNYDKEGNAILHICSKCWGWEGARRLTVCGAMEEELGVFGVDLGG